MGMPYKKKIDAPWVIEVISENFDGALELITDNNVVYGGAVRDALAEIPLEGDLDIAVSAISSNRQKQMFNESLKWKPISKKQEESLNKNVAKEAQYHERGSLRNRPVTESEINNLGYTSVMVARQQTQGLLKLYRNINPDTNNLFTVRLNSGKFTALYGSKINIVRDMDNVYYYDPDGKTGQAIMDGATTLATRKTSTIGTQIYRSPSKVSVASKRGNKYGNHVPMSSVSNFEGIGGVRAQIIVAKGNTQNIEDAIFKIVREVDILCCGVAMDKEGIIYELVEHAYEDCKNKILRLNPIVLTAELETPILEERIERLTKRGWKSEIDLKEVISKVKRMRISADKKAKAKFERHQARMAAKKSKKNKGNKESMFDYSKEVLNDIFEKKTKTSTWFTYHIRNRYLIEWASTTNLKAILINIAEKFPVVDKKILIQRSPLDIDGRTTFVVENNEFTQVEKNFLFGENQKLMYVGSSKSLPYGTYDSEISIATDKKKMAMQKAKVDMHGKMYGKITNSNPFKNKLKYKKRTMSKDETGNYLTNYEAIIGAPDLEAYWGGVDIGYKILQKRVAQISIPGMKLTKMSRSGRIIFECREPIRRDTAESITVRPTRAEIRRFDSNNDTYFKSIPHPKNKPTAELNARYKAPSVEVNASFKSRHRDIDATSDIDSFHTSYAHRILSEEIDQHWNGDTAFCRKTIGNRATTLGIKINISESASGLMCKLNRKEPFSGRIISQIFMPGEEYVKTREKDGGGYMTAQTGKWYGPDRQSNVSDAKAKAVAEEISMEEITNGWGGFKQFSRSVSEKCEHSGIRTDFTVREDTVIVTFRASRNISYTLVRSILTPPALLKKVTEKARRQSKKRSMLEEEEDTLHEATKKIIKDKYGKLNLDEMMATAKKLKEISLGEEDE